MRISKIIFYVALFAWSCSGDKEASSSAQFTLTGYSCNVGGDLSKYTFDEATVSCKTEGPAAPDELTRVFHTCDFREETAINDRRSYSVVSTNRTSDGTQCEIVTSKNTVKFAFENSQLSVSVQSQDNSQVTSDSFECKPIQQKNTSVSFTKCSEVPLDVVGIGNGLRRAPNDPDAFCWLSPNEYKSNYVYFYNRDPASIREESFFNSENCFFKNDAAYEANLPKELFEFSCRISSGSSVTYAIGSVDENAPTHQTYVKLCEEVFSQLNLK